MLDIKARSAIRRFLVYKKNYKSEEEIEKTIDLLEEISGVLIGMWSNEVLKARK